MVKNVVEYDSLEIVIISLESFITVDSVLKEEIQCKYLSAAGQLKGCNHSKKPNMDKWMDGWMEEIQCKVA